MEKPETEGTESQGQEESVREKERGRNKHSHIYNLPIVLYRCEAWSVTLRSGID
jgi:hypothetical protein